MSANGAQNNADPLLPWDLNDMLQRFLRLSFADVNEAPEEHNSTDVVLDVFLLPVDNYLPIFAGQSIDSICEGFNEELKAPHWKVKKSRKLLLESCQAPNDALYILKDDATVDNLSYEDIFKIAGMNPDIVLGILNHETLANHIYGDALANLGQNQPTIAKVILDTPKLYQKLDDDHLVTLGANHLSTARAILQHRDLKLGTYCTAKLAAFHESLAQEIFDNKAHYMEIFFKGHLPAYPYLGYHHLSIAKAIIADPYLRERLSPHDLAQLGSCHETIACQILVDLTLYSKLGGDHLAWLGMKHESVAHHILDNAAFCVLLEGGSLAMIGRHHLSVATRIMNTPVLRAKLHEGALVKLGRYHECIAQAILADKPLSESLDGSQLSQLGRNHSVVAQHILVKKAHRKKLVGSDLAKMVRRHLPLALAVLQDKSLLSKLDHLSLYLLGKAQPLLARHILIHNHLYDKLRDPEGLWDCWRWMYYMGVCHVATAKLIYNDHWLYDKLDEWGLNKRKDLEKRVTVVEQIKKLAKDLLYPKYPEIQDKTAICKIQ